jgi:3-methyladenine DNA glycosylase/8-oxoguanine DNA glycosylase
MLAYDPNAAIAHLRAADPILAGVIDVVGPFALQTRDGAFRSLAQAIFFQQLAGPAARAIMLRVLKLFDGDETRFFTPEQFLSGTDEELRAAGLSRQKLSYLRDLAEKCAAGDIQDDALASMEDEEVIRTVSVVKGIGRWTAEMFLIFSLGRPDVLPTDDLGVRRGFQRVYALDRLPIASEMQQIAEAWRPYRSVGTWYMWRSVAITLPG